MKVILTLLLKNISHQKTDILVSFVVNMMKYLPNSSQTLKQIELVKEVGLPEVSKLNYSVMNKNQGDQFPLEKETLEKRKWITTFPLISTLGAY